MSRMVIVGWALVLAGCSEPLPAAMAPEQAAGRVVEEGTPDALGLLAMLNDRATTVVRLDIDAAIDARAAKNLIARRDGPDGKNGTGDDNLFDNVAEVDAVPQVGEATLELLVTFARDAGYVTDDGVYGVVEGLTLTVVEAEAALGLANRASLTELDLDVGLDARAARGIVDGRPFARLDDVAAVPYVGAAAIEDLVVYGLAHPADLLDADAALAALDAGSAGLWFMSESDYPLEVFTLPDPGVALTPENAKAWLGDAVPVRDDRATLDERSVEERELAWFFDRHTWLDEGADDEQRATAAAWQALRDVFEQELEGAQVFRFGVARGGDLVGDIDVLLVARTADGQLVGVRTVSIET
jgi:hypothetical protein